MPTKADVYLIRDIKNIKENGTMDQNLRPKYKDGTPAHTLFVTHVLREYDLSNGEFPICTLRSIAWKSAIQEMLGIFQSKHMNLLLLNIWQEQYMQDSNELKPCEYETIFSVRGNFMDMLLIQRSGDMLVASGAGQWNEVQYAALLMMIARHTGREPGKFSHMMVKEQIYDRHMEQADMLEAQYNLSTSCQPVMTLNPEKTNFYDITIDDFSFDHYDVSNKLTFDIGI